MRRLAVGVVHNVKLKDEVVVAKRLGRDVGDLDLGVDGRGGQDGSDGRSADLEAGGGEALGKNAGLARGAAGVVARAGGHGRLPPVGLSLDTDERVPVLDGAVVVGVADGEAVGSDGAGHGRRGVVVVGP